MLPVEKFVGGDGQVLYPVRPGFEDGIAQTQWERVYPYLLFAYYSACARVSGSECSGDSGSESCRSSSCSGRSVASAIGAWNAFSSTGGGRDLLSAGEETRGRVERELFGRGANGSARGVTVGDGRGDGCVSGVSVQSDACESGGVGDGDVCVEQSGESVQSDGISGATGPSGGSSSGGIRSGDERSARASSLDEEERVARDEAMGSKTEVGARGKHYERNKRNKVRQAKLRRKVVESVAPSELGSQGGRCWTVKEESAAEKELREALERRKILEARLAARRAELNLERMNDKTMTDLYNARVKQEGISLMNQATQRSEKSLAQLRSVSPGSSATPGEIREAMLISESWKLKEKKIREWAARSGNGNEVLELLDEGKSTEVESLDTEDRALLAEYGTGSEADEDRYVEPSQAMKDETARVIHLSHKRHVEYVIRRLRGTGRDPASNLIGPELECYLAMTAEEIANVV